MLNTNESSLLTNTTSVTLRCGWSREPFVYSHTKILYVITYPILLLMATVGNILNLFILSRERPRNSKQVYLIGMAVMDFAFMWSGFVPYLNEVIKIPSIKYVHNQSAGVTLYAQDLCAFASDWIIVAFTVDRFLAIKSPLRHIRISTSNRSGCIVLGFVTLAAVSVLDDLVDYYWFLANDLGYGPIPVRPKALAQWRATFSWVLVLIPIGTFTVILVLNVFLMRVLSKKRQHRRVKLQASVSTSTTAKTSDKSAVLMLSSCVVLYVISQSPCFANNVMVALDYLCVRRRTRAFYSQFEPIRLFFINLNYSLNFYLYCTVSPAFRQSLKRYLMQSFGDSRQLSNFSVRSQFSRVPSKPANSRNNSCAKAKPISVQRT